MLEHALASEKDTITHSTYLDEVSKVRQLIFLIEY
jgi:hypothetical protein